MDKITSYSKEMNMPHSKTLPYLEALFAVIVWGASFIATKFQIIGPLNEGSEFDYFIHSSGVQFILDETKKRYSL
jgi:hypothetical protein